MTRNGSIRVGVCLSLSGKFARFGIQALRGLHAWRDIDGRADLLIEDDESDPMVLEKRLPRIAAQSDVVLGPYSTYLMRAAGRLATEQGWLLWNHGGSGDDVEVGHPGHVVSILAPASRYAEPFLQLLTNERDHAQLWIVYGKGRFGRQVAIGAERRAGGLGLDVVRVSAENFASPPDYPWDVFTVGQFEHDTALVNRFRSSSNPPRHICSVAAGVRDFRTVVDEPAGVFGIAQWFPSGNSSLPQLGPSEEALFAALQREAQPSPDYPTIQAIAGAVIGAHCVRLGSGLDVGTLWRAAVDLDTDTVYGGFRIDPITGAQVKHRTTLVRWDSSSAPSAVAVT